MKKTKKTNRKKTTKKKSSKFIYFFIAFLVISVFSLGTYLGYLISKTNTEKKIKHYENTLLTLQKKVEKLEKETKKLQSNKRKNIVVNSEIEDYKNAVKIIPPSITSNQSFNNKQKIKKPKKLANLRHKPKLVLIIDDVSFRYQTNLIKQIPYKITPSFFPPTKIHPNTPILAKSFKDYMVHVPMQAIHFKHPEPQTLNIDATYFQIKNRIEDIKRWFPKAKFINNHTGSTFTSNLPAMVKLFKVLKEENLGFVDSRTTPYSKGEVVERIYHIPFYKRNIFLDNEENSVYIRNQLKKAIKIAKKRGYAIAIGHPHKVTLLTIKNSKDLLNQVEVVYIDELNKNR